MKRIWHWIYHHTWLHWTYEDWSSQTSIRYCKVCNRTEYWDDHLGDWI